MTKWKEYKVEEFAEVIGGGTPSTKNPDYFGGSIPWITPKDLTNYEKKFIKNGDRNITKEGLNNSSAKLIPKNSILLTSRAPIGYLAIAENDVTTNQGFKSIVVNPLIADYNFVYYLIKANIERIKGYGTGTTFAEVSTTVVKNLKFFLPDLPTQTAIAEILSSLDDKIELNNKINQELENLAQSLFKQWFIDFEFPNEYGEPYKSSGGEMFDSELGDIPKGWEVKKTGDLGLYISDLVANGSFASIKENVKTSDNKDYALFIRNTDLKNRFKSQKLYVNKHSFDFLKKTELIGGEIILPNVGDVGSVHRCPKFDFPMTLGNNCIMVKSDYMQNWLYTFFRSTSGFHSLRSVVVGSVQDKLSKTNFKSIKIIIPNSDILQISETAFMSIYNLQENNLKESDEYEILRDTLLPKLISGDLDVTA